MRSGLLPLFCVTIVMGFVVGVYSMVSLRPPLEHNAYRQPILIVAVVACVATIITGLSGRSEIEGGARPIADAVITLGVVALMLLTIQILVSLLIPFPG